jgi:hypothetical protein
MALNFTLHPKGYWFLPGWRALTYKPSWEGTDRIHKGWDVYALQTALNFYAKDPKIVEDGWFGPRTLTAVRRFQKNRNLEADGAAGGLTQTTILRGIIPSITDRYNLPKNGVKGGVEKESGNWVGNHTEQYPDSSWDAGPPQINDLHKGLPFDFIFNVPKALDFYGKTIRASYDKYDKEDPNRATRLDQRGLDTVLTEQRKWELAFGSWNRPAHTAWLAGQPKGETQEGITGPLSASQREWIEGYIDRVTVYITDWTP